jgi:hypothetical protein
MSSKEEMKRYVITEFGQQFLYHVRQFVIKVPEGCDPKALDGQALYRAADGAEVGWKVADPPDIEHDHYLVERVADEEDSNYLRVIQVEIPDDKEDFDDLRWRD